jgi:hypothetical protein
MRNIVLLSAAAAFVSSITASASGVIAVSSSTDAMSLASNIFPTSANLTIKSAKLSTHVEMSNPGSGTFFATSNNYGLYGSGAVLSTGWASRYGSGANTEASASGGPGVAATPAQSVLLDPITGQIDHFDVTQLDVVLEAAWPGKMTFGYVFGTEEYPEFVGSDFIDGFGIYVNGVNIAKPNARFVNVNHPGLRVVAETELDGVLVPLGSSSPVIQSVANFAAGTFKVTFIIGDASDSALDSTVYIGGTRVFFRDDGSGADLVVPAPSSIAVGSLALVMSRRRRA